MTWEYIDGIIWGENNVSNPSELLKPGDNNVILAGWPAGKPNRQYFNWILHLAANNLGHLERSGFPTWAATVTYDTYAIVRFGAKHYVSLQTANVNKNPGTETAWWKDYYVWLSEQAGQVSTNQTVANFNDGYFYPHPEYASSSTVNLTGDNILLPNLQIYPLSVTPLTITAPSLVAQTWYYIYVAIPAGSDVIAGDVSITTTPPTWDPALGMFRDAGATARCVGYLEGHNSGNGDIEPFIVAEGWYQRRDKKRRLATYSPAPQANTALFSGTPDTGGRRVVEIGAFSFEVSGNAVVYADNGDYTGSIGDGDTGYSGAPYGILYNGQLTTGSSLAFGTNPNVSTGGTSIVMTDAAGNMIVAGDPGGQDEAMTIWLRKFKLPRGIFS